MPASPLWATYVPGKIPPPVTKYGWQYAENYYNTFDSYSVLKNLKADYHIAKALLQTPYLDNLVQIRDSFKESAEAVKKFRQEVKKNKIPVSELEQRGKEVYMGYASSMNEMERFTDYRFDSGDAKITEDVPLSTGMVNENEQLRVKRAEMTHLLQELKSLLTASKNTWKAYPFQNEEQIKEVVNEVEHLEQQCT